jgi:sugar/nucleoside kinase (ribokinase family)
MLNVLAWGDNVVDVYPPHQHTMYPGGNALNFAVFARQLGYSSAYLGVFGDDAPAAHVYQVASHCDWI